MEYCRGNGGGRWDECNTEIKTGKCVSGEPAGWTLCVCACVSDRASLSEYLFTSEQP